MHEGAATVASRSFPHVTHDSAVPPLSTRPGEKVPAESVHPARRGPVSMEGGMAKCTAQWHLDH